MIKIKDHVLMDLNTNRKIVQLSYHDYERLMEYVEDIEDSLALRKAKKEASGFTSLEDLKKELQSV